MRTSGGIPFGGFSVIGGVHYLWDTLPHPSATGTETARRGLYLAYLARELLISADPGKAARKTPGAAEPGLLPGPAGTIAGLSQEGLPCKDGPSVRGGDGPDGSLALIGPPGTTDPPRIPSCSSRQGLGGVHLNRDAAAKLLLRVAKRSVRYLWVQRRET